MDLTAYQHLIRRFIYLNYRTHPNIVFVVGQLSHYNSDLLIAHLCIAKQVLRYLKEMITLGIKWGNNPASHRLGEIYGELEVVEYADSGYAGNQKNKKSITGYGFLFIGAIVT